MKTPSGEALQKALHCEGGSASDDPSMPPADRTADPDLRLIVTAWPTLPECVRADIVARVKAAGARA